MSGLKLGILRLGRVAGKSKYALLDERDISIVQQHAIEPRVEVDKNGNGARIYAIAHDIGKSRSNGRYLHEFLWERHKGGIAPGWKVVHKNNVTVDNRLDNLELVKDDSMVPQHQDEGSGGPTKNRETSLYWITVTQLLGDPLEMNYHHINKWYDFNGDVVDPAGESYIYYECHYPPCTRMERELREFSICGRCQEVRYCGTSCQERDWPSHKRFCRERRRHGRESTPDRYCGTSCQERDLPSHKRFFRERRRHWRERTPDRYCGTSCQERDLPSHKRFFRERRRHWRERTPDRYCGTSCQERDWPSHKRFFRERRRHWRERTPDR